MQTEVSTQQIENYRQQGFLVLEGFLDAAELEHWRQVTGEAVRLRLERSYQPARLAPFGLRPRSRHRSRRGAKNASHAFRLRRQCWMPVTAQAKAPPATNQLAVTGASRARNAAKLNISTADKRSESQRA
jgi:hypothetical protein